jgi:hypothetical protein
MSHGGMGGNNDMSSVIESMVAEVAASHIDGLFATLSM